MVILYDTLILWTALRDRRNGADGNFHLLPGGTGHFHKRYRREFLWSVWKMLVVESPERPARAPHLTVKGVGVSHVYSHLHYVGDAGSHLIQSFINFL